MLDKSKQLMFDKFRTSELSLIFNKQVIPEDFSSY